MRIAGVNVGKVTEVEHLTSAEPRIDRAGRRAPPATGASPRPAGRGRDDGARRGRAAAARGRAPSSSARACSSRATTSSTWSPGSPSAPEVDDGHTFPVNQTAYSVQLDQVLTTLQGDVRADLQTLPRPVRQRADQARRRRGLPRALPHLAAGLQVHLAGQRGGARHRAAATSAA